ncbi:hypothetical protein [Burkholderia pyrrocinia]|uniref:Core-binding (CB) domain-containing protein n=1 Tax=Burkholderia pyrrocinia TaxID=60550 RepID=A0ABZ3BNW6_BURPY
MPKIICIIFGMRKQNSHTFSEVVVGWLHSKSALADVTRTAYKGEVNRLAEHFAHAGIRHVRAVTREAWWDYLNSLDGRRPHIDTKRSKGLSHGSIQQARRISRDFFMWALDEKIIDWLPRLPESPSATAQRRDPRAHTNPRCDIDSVLAGILLGEAKAEDIRECRAHVTFNLVFWGALKPATLAKLRVRDLTRSSAIDAGSANGHRVELPEHVVRQWKRYSQLRRRVFGKAPLESAPLISHLDSEDAISAWGIWSIFHEWEKSRRTHEDLNVTPRTLRSAYLDLLCSSSEQTLRWAYTHGGVRDRRVQVDTEAIPQGIVTEAHDQILLYLKAV